MKAKTVLVLSAGGMFASYQAGAWRELEDALRPDAIVGASAGALNAWAIAGGCPGEELERMWLGLDAAAACRWRFPKGPLAGVIDTAPIEQLIRALHARFQPRIEIGIVITDLLRLRPELVTGAAIGPRHLIASCSVLGLFPQPSIGGRIYTDGGLLGAAPVWAAVALGASRVLLIDALPSLPLAPVRAAARALRGLSGVRPAIPDSLRVARIAPAAPLGGVRDAIAWNRDNARRWIGQGRLDARRLKHSLFNLS